MPLDGIKLGHYQLLRLIGRGGMGEVYLAKDTRLKRQVAIKVMHSDADLYNEDATQEMLRLFRREMQAITMLDHPHILPIFDYGEEKIGNFIYLYMVIPLRLEGSFSDWLRQRQTTISTPLTPGEIGYFIQQAAEALQHAHNHHLVHQDVKPANFLIRSKETHPNQQLLLPFSNQPDLQLADFGLVRFSSTSFSHSQSVRGTPTFMAPEQWDGRPESATDQYALAVMTYLLLTGRPPFQGMPSQIMRQHITAQPQPPSSLNGRVPRALDEVVLRGLAKKPDDRFPFVSAFAVAFQQAVQSGPLLLPAPTKRTDKHPALNKASIGLPPPQVPSVLRINPISPTPAAKEMSPLAASQEERAQHISSIQHVSGPIGPFSSRGGSGSSEATDAGEPEPHKVKRRLPAFVFAIVVVVVSGLLITVPFWHNFTTPSTSATVTPDQAGTINAATSTAAAQNALVTATAETIAANPNRYIQNSGPLGLYDPLKDNNRGYLWDEQGQDPSCMFKDGAYHVVYGQGKNGICSTHGSAAFFSSLTYEVHMKIVSGDCGGIMLMAPSSKEHFFQICQDGTYSFSSYNSLPLVSASSPAIHTGLNQDNIIAIILIAPNNGSATSTSGYQLFVNHQKINSFPYDLNGDSGGIGVFAKSLATNYTTEVVFSNARVWNLG